jgi:hypothetical protein
MTLLRITGIGLFTALGAGSVAIVLSIAGELSADSSEIALRCGSLAGAFVGLWLANRLESRNPKHIVGLGAGAGVLLHPVMWFIYINFQSIQAGLSGLDYIKAWIDVAPYTLASLPQAGAVTLPLCLAGTWLLSRRLPPDEPASPPEPASVSSGDV